MNAELADMIEQAGRNMRSASQSLQDARTQAAELCRQAHEAGWSEVALANGFGVNRLTVRRWLGK